MVYLITLCDSTQFEIVGLNRAAVADMARMISHNKYNSIPIYSICEMC